MQGSCFYLNDMTTILIKFKEWEIVISEATFKLKEHKIYQSMSRKGNYLDNSPIENFFGLLKKEIYYSEVYRSFSELKIANDGYIYYYINE